MNSRVHRLNTFDFPDITCYVKRDDELSFGVSGTKLRKYTSLIPFLIEQKIKEVVIAGGSHSNHILSLAQLLREKKFKITLFFGGNRPSRLTGNLLLTSLIIPSEDIHWLPKGEEEKAAEIYTLYRQKENAPTFYIPLGAPIKESIPGVMSLIYDLDRNEKELGLQFDHIFIDSGTGTTAAIAILGSALLRKKTHFHVIQMASNSQKFNLLLEQFQKELPVINSPLRYSLYAPQTARSFGSTNASTWKTIAHMARHEGIFVDPIYNAKLFHEGKKILEKGTLKGNILFIHSGGGLSLTGFMEKLGNIVAKEIKND